MDRLRALEIFTEVARGRSFTAAARRLGMAKGNVTKYVAWLEKLLEAQLLNRTTKSVSLTEAGMYLVEEAQDLLERFEVMGAAVHGAVKEPVGTIRIGTQPSFGAAHLVPMIATFSASYPDIQFALYLDDGHIDIAGEGLDLSLRITPELEDSSLVALKLGSVPQVLVAASAYLEARGTPKKPDDLADHDCLVNTQKSPTSLWPLLGPGGRRLIRVTGPLRSNFGEALRNSALSGHGISMHPIYMVAQDIREGRLKVVLPTWKPTELDIFAVYPSRRNIPMRVKLFLEFLHDRFHDTVEWQDETED